MKDNQFWNEEKKVFDFNNFYKRIEDKPNPLEAILKGYRVPQKNLESKARPLTTHTESINLSQWLRRDKKSDEKEFKKGYVVDCLVDHKDKENYMKGLVRVIHSPVTKAYKKGDSHGRFFYTNQILQIYELGFFLTEKDSKNIPLDIGILENSKGRKDPKRITKKSFEDCAKDGDYVLLNNVGVSNYKMAVVAATANIQSSNVFDINSSLNIPTRYFNDSDIYQVQDTAAKYIITLANTFFYLIKKKRMSSRPAQPKDKDEIRALLQKVMN